MPERVSHLSQPAHRPEFGASRPAKSLGFLAWIASYKLIKAALATVGGFAVLRLGNRNLVEFATQLLIRFGFDPEGWVGTRLIHHLGHFNPHHLHFAGQLLFVYAVLYSIEAFGLFFEKRWAEWLTIVQTALLIPVEVFELHRRVGPIKLAALIFSVSVVIYLLWRIWRDNREEAACVAAQSLAAPGRR